MSTKALETHLKPIMPFLMMDGVTEICINKPEEIFVEKHSQFQKYSIPELEFGFIETLAALVAEFNKKEFPHPLISGVLPTGARVQFVMNPSCENEKIICSIRRHQMKDMSLDSYRESGAFDNLLSKDFDRHKKINDELSSLYYKKDFLGFLNLAVLSRKNIIISGGTGTGKTTLLNAFLKLIPSHERIISVEDTREVFIRNENAVNLLFNEDDERITAEKVFKVCLRLRPDRILLSELRAAEVWSFLRAANSGHPGSFSTVHADTPEACFDQMVFMMQQAGSTSSDINLRNYIKSIVNIVIQIKRCSSADRFMQIPEIYFDAIHKTGGNT